MIKMFKKTDMSTYSFKSVNDYAIGIGGDGKALKDEEGNYELYDKEDVVDIVDKLINKKMIRKGIKVDRPNSKYIIYRFDYSRQDREGEEHKFAHRIKIDKRYLEDNKKYMDRLDAMVISAKAIRFKSGFKKAMAGVGFALATGALVAAFEYAAEKEFQSNNERLSEYYQEFNQERINEGYLPLEAVEQGFEGSYSDWAKSQSGYVQDENGNWVLSEEQIQEQGFHK